MNICENETINVYEVRTNADDWTTRRTVVEGVSEEDASEKARLRHARASLRAASSRRGPEREPKERNVRDYADRIVVVTVEELIHAYAETGA